MNKMKLIGVKAEGSLEELRIKSNPDDLILLCETESWGDWHADRLGVVIERDGKMLLNDDTETLWQPPEPSSCVIVPWNKGGKKQLLLNGTIVLYEGPYDGYDYHAPSGTLVIRIGNKFFMVAPHNN